MAFIPIGKLEDIAPLGARRYRRADGVEIAVFRTEGDGVFALRDKCPHKGGPLSQGIVFGDSPLGGAHIFLIGGLHHLIEMSPDPRVLGPILKTLESLRAT